MSSVLSSTCKISLILSANFRKTFYVCVIRYLKSRDIWTIYNLTLKGKIPLFLKALRCSNFNEMRWKCFWHYSFSVEIHRLNEYKTYFRSLLKCEDVKCCPKEILNITEENSDIDYEGMILSHQNHEKRMKRKHLFHHGMTSCMKF